MKLSLIVAPLIAAKVPHDVIMETILAFEAQQTDALEKRREADRKRQARKRSSRDVTGSHTGSRSRAGGKGSSNNLDITGEDKEGSPSAPSKKAQRLPADWTLPDDWRAEAIAAGLPADRVTIEADKMRNWSLSAKTGAKLDWLAVWRNWFRSAIDKLPRIVDPPPKKVTHANMWTEDAIAMGIIDDPAKPKTRHLEPSLARGQNQGTGLARRIASA